MIADVVDVISLFSAVFSAGENTADVGFADSAGTEAGGIGQQSFQELDRNDILSLEFDGDSRKHSDVFKAFHMGKIALPEGHKEAYAFYFGYVFGERFDLFVMKQIHIFYADFIKIVFALYAHCRDLDPAAVFPITAGRRYLAQVYLRIKVCRERISVVAAVAIEYIDGVDLVKFVFFGISAVSLSDARVESAAEQRGKSGAFELFAVRPLPGIIEISRKPLFLAAFFIYLTPFRIVGILRLVICGIHVINAAFEAGVHYCKILIRKRYVHYEIGLIRFYQRDKLVHVVGVHLSGGDDGFGSSRKVGGECVAFGFCSRSNAQFGEHFVDLAAFSYCDVGNSAAAYNKYSGHNNTPELMI